MEKTLKTYFELFMQEKRVAGLSARTLSDYQRHFAAFERHVPQGDEYRAGVLSYLGENIAANTHNIRRAYLRSFFGWCVESGYLSDNPLKGLKKRKPVNRIVNVDDDTVAKMLQLPDRSTFAGFRDYCLMMFSIDTGTRPNEALSLIAKDFDFTLGVVIVPAAVAKTRESRTLPLSPQTVAAVKMLLSYHSTEWLDAPVFCNNRGGRFNVISWTHNLSEYGKRLDVHISAYHLRHVAALSLLRGGMDVITLSRIMGHSTVAMTQKYLSLQLSDLRQSHAKASLINNLMPQAVDEAPRQRAFSHRVMRLK